MERWMRAEGDGGVKNKRLTEDMMVRVGANGEPPSLLSA